MYQMSLVRAYDAVNSQMKRANKVDMLEKRVKALEERVIQMTATLCKLQNIPVPKKIKPPEEEEITCRIN